VTITSQSAKRRLASTTPDRSTNTDAGCRSSRPNPITTARAT